MRKQKSRSEKSSVLFKATGGFWFKLHSSYFAASPPSTWNPPFPPSADPSPHPCSPLHNQGPCSSVGTIITVIFFLMILAHEPFFSIECFCLTDSCSFIQSAAPPSFCLVLRPTEGRLVYYKDKLLDRQENKPPVSLLQSLP